MPDLDEAAAVPSDSGAPERAAQTGPAERTGRVRSAALVGLRVVAGTVGIVLIKVVHARSSVAAERLDESAAAVDHPHGDNVFRVIAAVIIDGRYGKGRRAVRLGTGGARQSGQDDRCEKKRE